MKSLFVFITFLVIAAGVVAGRLDYEAEKRSASRPLPSGAGPSAAGAMPTGAGANTGTSGGDLSAPAGESAAARTRTPQPVGSAKDGGPPRAAQRDGRPGMPASQPAAGQRLDSSATESGGSGVGPGVGSGVAGIDPGYELSQGAAQDVSRIETALQRHDFDEAERVAGLLAARSGDSEQAYVAARQLEAKARIYRQLMAPPEDGGTSPSPESGTGTTGFHVELANGNKITARRVERANGHYVVVLENGNKFRPPLEDVLEVTKVQDAPQRVSWDQLSAKLEGVVDPIELYVRGVKKSCRAGRRREAYDLMERVLALPDSDAVPMLFAHEGGVKALRDWRTAAGRVSPEEILRARGPAAARTQNLARPPPPRQGSAVSRSESTVDPSALSRAESLVRSARSLYSNSVGKEGRTGDLKEARRRLDQAMGILEPLPDSASVNHLRQELGQLLYDVIRALPF